MKTWSATTRFLPIITLDNADDALPLARALLAGGIDAIEFTLRTPAALAGIKSVAQALPDMHLGAGTISSIADFEAAYAAGARFFVSPGLDPTIADWPKQKQLLWLPGVQTASEVMVARRLGFSQLKFFPAESAGSTAALKNIHPVYPELRFIPTGGIGQTKVADYLALPCVMAVGGSWVTPKTAIENKDWAKITELARAATAAV